MIQKYKVNRQIQFDRAYAAGDSYEGNAAEVAHLVANGVLTPLGSKAEREPRNKADAKLDNKSA